MFDNSKVRFYEWGELHSMELNIYLGVSAFRSMSLSNEDILKTAEKSIEKINQNDKENIQQSEYSSLTIEEIKKHQRYSTILGIFSFLEKQLNDISELTCLRLKLNFKKNKKSSIIQNHFSFLKDIVGINVNTIEPLFEIINRERNIRNIIAHSNGIVSLEDKDWVICQNGVSIEKIGDKDQLNIAETIYIEYLLRNIERFLIEITVSLDDQILISHENK